MKHLIFGLISVSMIAGSIAACSSSSSGTSAQDGCTSTGNALVAYAQRCEGDLDPAQSGEYSARYAQLCQAQLALPGVPSSYGTQLAACAAAVQSADCNTDIEQIDACTFNTAGTLANGTACTAGLQCASNSCSAGTTGGGNADGGSSTTTNCGTCQPAIADGASCENGGTCVSGDTCVFSTSSSGTFSATCTKKAPPAGVGATCQSADDCQAPNHCAPPVGTSETGVCAAPGTSGIACEENSDCASGLTCAVNMTGGGADRTCVTALAAGAACTEGQCGVGLGCDLTTAKCKAVVFAAPLAACDGVVTLCSKGNCDTSDTDAGTGAGGSTCPTIIADGQPCSLQSQTATCDDFASCTNGVCTFTPGTCQ